MVDRTIYLATKAASQLEYTTDSLEEIAEKDPEIAEVVDSTNFLKHFDSLIFNCVTCNWWKRQRENATPKGDEWVCQECADE
jgi:hypothetical protein